MGKQRKPKTKRKSVATNNTLSTAQQVAHLQLADTLLRLALALINLLSKFL